MKVAIYRVLIDDYDYSIEDPFLDKNYDYYLFTNQRTNKFKNYKKIFIKDNELNPSLQNRKLKIIIPEILLSYDVVIYLDNNIKICAPINKILKKFYFSDCEIGFCKHPYGHTLTDEINSCINFNQSKKEDLFREISYYKKNNISAKEVLTDNSFLIRRINTLLEKNYSSEWFEYVKNFSGRDQISLPFIRSKFKLKEMLFDFSPRKFNNYFSVLPHKFKYERKRKKKLVRHIISLTFKIIFMYYLFIRYSFFKVKTKYE
ncbi:MAG: hypothetical protein CMB29_05790 [Euryarchaeota archaeon]|nr:hypothetical protein [Euryarchaeota archaeon]|tara:strand:- start:8885 stop:9664 length:780 start_codon:yes stop_codon:yes gene_type:complete